MRRGLAYLLILWLMGGGVGLAFQRGIQIDPGFAYWQGRSEASIADELKRQGYDIIHVFITNENHVPVKFVQAMKDAGFEVWAMVLGNGTYSTANFPAGWEDWKMELNNTFPGYTFFCLNHPEYREWKKVSLGKVITAAPFDGVEIAEPFVIGYGGPTGSAYGCLSERCASLFSEWSGQAPLNFTNPRSADYFSRRPEAYALWGEFRVETVNDFYDEIVNGKGGLREVRPDILISTWTLAVDEGPKSVDNLRLWEGMDALSMVERVRPDRHAIQTHWPDWVKPNLAPDYIKAYEAFAAPVREAFPDLPIMLQTDIGSNQYMRRSGQWIEQFEAKAAELGYHSTMHYEYHLGMDMYTQAPRFLEAERLPNQRVRLVFDRRIDAMIGGSALNYEIRGAGNNRWVSMAVVDGNSVLLLLHNVPDDLAFDLEVFEMANTPELLIFKGTAPQVAEVGIVHVPALK